MDLKQGSSIPRSRLLWVDLKEIITVLLPLLPYPKTTFPPPPSMARQNLLYSLEPLRILNKVKNN